MEKEIKKEERAKKKEIRQEWREEWRRNRRHDSGGVIWGVFLILVGITFLLVNMGLVSPFIWEALVRFWPVLLIMAGLHIILGDNPTADLVMFILSLLVLGSVWIKALAQVNSPIVEMWGLNSLPWFEWLKQFNFRY